MCCNLQLHSQNTQVTKAKWQGIRMTAHTTKKIYWQLCTCCAYYLPFVIHFEQTRKLWIEEDRVWERERNCLRMRNPDRVLQFDVYFDLESIGKMHEKCLWGENSVMNIKRSTDTANVGIYRLPTRKFHRKFQLVREKTAKINNSIIHFDVPIYSMADGEFVLVCCHMCYHIRLNFYACKWRFEDFIIS